MITPVTNRADSSTRTRLADIERIADNYEELFSISLTRSWRTTGIVDVADWEAICSVAKAVGEAYGLDISNSTNFVNLNNIEMVVARAVENPPRRLAFRLPARREF